MVSNLSVWVLPEEGSPEFLKLKEIINHLASRNDRHPYLPHSTLSILRADTDVSRVLNAINAVKANLFKAEVKFHELFSSPGAAVGVHGVQDPVLLDLQKRFHEALGTQGYSPAFPHFSLAYCNKTEETIQYLHSEGLCKKIDQGHIEIGGYAGFRIGAIYAAYCGDLRPEKWRIFLKVRESGEEWVEQPAPDEIHSAEKSAAVAAQGPSSETAIIGTPLNTPTASAATSGAKKPAALTERLKNKIVGIFK